MAESADIIARDAQNAARLSPDVGREKVGEIYARALLGAAENAGQTAAVLEELDAIVSEVFAQFPKLETVLGSLLVSHEEKAVVLDRVFADRISRLLLNFLKVVSRHGRLDCLRAIRHQARKLYEEMQGNVRVRMTTATAVDPRQIEQIAAALGRVAGPAADSGDRRRSGIDRRGRPSHWRHRLRRLRRQPIAIHSPADDR